MTSAGHRSHREQRATPCHRMCVVCRDSCAGRVGAPARQTNSFRNSKLSVSLSSYVDIPWRADCVVPSCSRSQSFFQAGHRIRPPPALRSTKTMVRSPLRSFALTYLPMSGSPPARRTGADLICGTPSAPQSAWSKCLASSLMHATRFSLPICIAG